MHSIASTSFAHLGKKPALRNARLEGAFEILDVSCQATNQLAGLVLVEKCDVLRNDEDKLILHSKASYKDGIKVTCILAERELWCLQLENREYNDCRA